ncbi:MAG: 2,3-bisphosphoglycerate-independent phosphoglycerate mutase [Candidatus Niyogibacteria bacterium]|nr:2,3-bisphosphoglycerate-independent phosphoglycerate mutase [Candidatus Niyogibacteria bacterium]
MPYKPVVLAVLDGFGVNIGSPQSTWRYAKRPTFEMLEKHCPFTVLQASGTAVGLPWGEEGNSEVGHRTMGAGRAIYSHLPRISLAIEDGSFFSNPAFEKAVGHVRKNQSRLHAMGLFSSGSVHAHADHLYAMLEFARRAGIAELYLHLFTDGRDAPQQEAAGWFMELEKRLVSDFAFAKIASVIGRRWALDRDGHWDFIEKTYQLLTIGKGAPYAHPSLHIEANYAKKITDEFIEAGYLEESGLPVGRIQKGDAVLFLDFREDSARELTSAFVLDGFDRFGRRKIPNLLFVTMTQYDQSFPAEVAFEPILIEQPLSRVVSEAGLRQLHIAETEKYAHVTYFFNGGREERYPNEDWVLIPSPEASPEKAPEMSAPQITEAVIAGLGTYDFILVNYANADMVGHTGNFTRTAEALEALDRAMSVLVPAVIKSGGALVITSDHGNAEEKLYRQTGEARTKHTSNPVPFFLATPEVQWNRERTGAEIEKQYRNVQGVLADVAPTVLELLGLRSAPDMTGVSLIPILSKP